MAERRSGDVPARLGSLPSAVTRLAGSAPGAGGSDPLRFGSLAAGLAKASSLTEHRSNQRTLLGRLASVFYVGCGLLVLVTLLLPEPGTNRAAIGSVATAAVVVGVAVWFAPWGAWSQRASLVAIVPPAFALIALVITYGGADLDVYSVFFVVAFVWIGLAQPPRTALMMAPLAIAACVLPLLALRSNFVTGLAPSAITIGVSVLVGEAIAWGMLRLEGIERALYKERSRSEQLRELDNMKDAFLSTVSHELRTPLTVCRGHLDVLNPAAGRGEVQAVKGMLLAELALMSRLVDDLTTLARVGDRVLLKTQAIPLDEFVSNIVAMAEPILGDRLHVEYEPQGATLRADPQRLTQALLNLLQNAARHARGEGPVRFRVRAERYGWRFEVADEGGGLPPGEEDVIFQPFRTGSSPTGRTGLGLAIVRGIARAHRGSYGVVNDPGRGATFWIRIPR
jgi:signal transduction histidine kinase